MEEKNVDTSLIEKIRTRRALISVVGLGYVGLPTAIMFANAGFAVIGADINEEIVEKACKGQNYIGERGFTSVLQDAINSKRFTATTDVAKACRDTDVSFVAVQTPVKEKRPDLSFLEKACITIAKCLTKGKLVIIESTVPPKTTRSMIAPKLEKISGLECGKDFWLAHCPEQVIHGKIVQELVKNPRVIGGWDDMGSMLAAELYKTVVNSEISTCDCTTSEVVKLTENTFRDVNIAFANEIAMICETLRVDASEVITLANKHPRVNVHRPGCGVGGSCLPKDPLLLLSSFKEKGQVSKIIRNARQINDYMPKHTVDLIVNGINKAGKDIKSVKIAILGVAYKGGSNNTANAPAEKIIRRLLALGARVSVFDPFVRKGFGAELAESVYRAVRKADCLLIVTDHNIFKKLKLERIRSLMNEKPVIVDGRWIINRHKAEMTGFLYFAVGVTL